MPSKNCAWCYRGKSNLRLNLWHDNSILNISAPLTSHVARLHGVNANQIFAWRKQYQEGSLTAIMAGEDVVPASELAAAVKQIKELQRLLGKKTMENELLKEAVEYGRQKKWIAHAPLLPGDGD
ncbi:IS2 repressor TnpA [Serratia ficaria]|nr:IS2 repressor TnpA [Serratia ficaria]CAI2536292.1 IS2 repressor TnpA [Serratia ficaria]CAI2536848.1 IS2 repressor TnpA [Serratia ficaria]CAI2538545.1 IS2 repressor TnpA [Serratia ficaria]